MMHSDAEQETLTLGDDESADIPTTDDAPYVAAEGEPMSSGDIALDRTNRLSGMVGGLHARIEAVEKFADYVSTLIIVGLLYMMWQSLGEGHEHDDG